MSTRVLRTVMPPSGGLLVYRNERLYIGGRYDRDHLMEAWFGCTKVTQTNGPVSRDMNSGYQLWTTAEGDDLFPGSFAGVDEVDKAILPRAALANAFLELEDHEKFHRVKHFYESVCSGRYFFIESEDSGVYYFQETADECERTITSKKRKRLADDPGGYVIEDRQRKLSRVAKNFHQLSISNGIQTTPCSDEDDDEWLPNAPARKQSIVDTVDTSTNNTNGDTYGGGRVVKTETGAGISTATAAQQTHGNTDEASSCATRKLTELTESSVDTRDFFLALGQRWARVVNQNSQPLMHSHIGALFSAQDRSSAMAPSQKLIESLRWYRNHLDYVLLQERNSLYSLTAVGVPKIALHQHKEIMRQYENLLAELDGDLQAMTSFLEKAVSTARSD